MRFTLNSLASVAADWLFHHSDASWILRYGHRIEETRFPKAPAARQALAEEIGHDGLALLADIFDDRSPLSLRELPALHVLRQIADTKFLLGGRCVALAREW